MTPARLRPSSAVDHVFREGSVLGGPLLAFRYVTNGTSDTRWGFAVGKKLEKRASARNRLRRRLRALAGEADVPPGYDIVVLARTGALDASFSDLRARFHALAHRLPTPAGPSTC